MNQYKKRPRGPVKYIITKEIPDNSLGIECRKASLDTHAPKNKFIPKKCTQKIVKKVSFENSE